MKNKNRIRSVALLLAVVLCMTAFSTVAYAGGGDGEPYYTEQPTESAEPEATPEPSEETGGSTLLILLVLLVLGEGGALVYIKVIKPKQSVKGGTDLDELDFDEDNEDSDIYQPEDGEQEDEE